MKNSFKMAKLDYLSVKNSLLQYKKFMPLILLLSFVNTNLLAIAIFMAMFIMILVLNAFYQQEKYGLNNLYKSLSLSDKDIVLGRYIFAFMSLFVISAITFILFCLSKFIHQTDIIIQELPFAISVIYLVFTIAISIIPPIYFKFGFIRSQNIHTIIELVMIILFVIIVSNSISFNYVITFIINNKQFLTVIFSLLSTILWYLSYKAAIFSFSNNK